MHTEAKPSRAILWAGLIAGILDLTAAFVTGGLQGASPVRISQSIASGLLGASAFQGGLPMAALGVVLHFVIAFGAAAVYVAASRKLRVLMERPVLCGVLYGIAVYVVMTFVVVPLSAAPFLLGQTPGALATGLAVHILCIGLPIALVTRRLVAPRRLVAELDARETR
jgi:uncharacterized membrane protein YagU involved in acid resistance